MADVLTTETRSSESDYNMDLEIVTNLQCKDGSMMLLLWENAILRSLVDGVLIVMRLKTYLLRSNFARRVDSDVFDHCELEPEP